MLLLITAPDVFSVPIFDSGKNHIIKDVPTIITWLWLKKKEHPDPHLLFLSLSKRKEILIKLFPTLYSARKRKLSACAGGSSAAMTGCSLSTGVMTLALLSAPTDLILYNIHGAH